MRNELMIGVSALAIATSLFALQRQAEFGSLAAQFEELTTERNSLLQQLRDRESAILVLTQENKAVRSSKTEPPPTKVEEASDLEGLEPEVTIGERGKKNYFFKSLHGNDGRIIAREAQFRELLGLTKLSFKTSEGTRYFGIDDVHPKVLASLGFDAAVLKRRTAEERAQMELRGAQAKLHQELRVQAAVEAAARETAAAERSKAEAAIREAQAKERLATLAEEMAANPPRPPQVNVRVINVDKN